MTLSLTRSRLLGAAAATLVFAAHGAIAEDHDTKEAWRLFVADHTDPVVRAIDFADGKELEGKPFSIVAVGGSGASH